MSKVVHTRLDEITVAGCCDLMEKLGQTTQDKTISRIVAMCLEAYINRLQESNQLPRYTTSGQAAERIRRAIGMGDLDLDEDLTPTDLNFDSEATRGLDGIELIHRPPQDVTKGIAGLVEERMEAERVKSSLPEQEVEIRESVEDEAPPPCPWEGLSGIPIETVLSTGISDKRLDEAIALADADQPFLLLSYQIAFSKVPQSEWKTELPHTLAKSLHKTFINWAEKYGQE